MLALWTHKSLLCSQVNTISGRKVQEFCLKAENFHRSLLFNYCFPAVILFA